jgi:hypothetical protein
MTSRHTLSLSVALPYAQAGVEFRLRGVCRAGSAPTVEVTAVPYDGEQPLHLQQEAVPVLEDFAPGFARWLRMCHIDAEVTTQAIRGSMPPDATAEQLLLAISRACDMLDQRFSQYTESILA